MKNDQIKIESLRPILLGYNRYCILSFYRSQKSIPIVGN